MAAYNLLGAGVQGLTPGVTRILVDIVTYPQLPGAGRAAPTNYYDVGLLREGVLGSFGPSIPIDAASMFIDLADGVNQLGYSLFGSTSIRVTEQFSSGPTGNQLLMPWDRHPTTFGDQNLVGVSAALPQTQFLFYTVPAGRIAMLSEAYIVWQNITAVTGLNASASMSVQGIAMLNQYMFGLAQGAHEEASLAGGPLYVPSGGTIEMDYTVSSMTSGSTAVGGSFGGTLFDA